MDSKKKTKSSVKHEQALEIIQKLPPEELFPILEESGIIKRNEEVRSFRGPLPPQVLDLIDKKTSEKLVNNFIQHMNSQDKLNETMISKFHDDKKNDRLHATLKILIASVIGLTIFLVSIFTNNIKFLKDLIPLLASVGGGTGIGIYYFFKRTKKEEKPQIEVEE